MMKPSGATGLPSHRRSRTIRRSWSSTDNISRRSASPTYQKKNEDAKEGGAIRSTKYISSVQRIALAVQYMFATMRIRDRRDEACRRAGACTGGTGVRKFGTFLRIRQFRLDEESPCDGTATPPRRDRGKYRASPCGAGSSSARTTRGFRLA